MPNKLSDGIIVADIGGGKYDHHQIDAKRRKDGHKYAACGLLLQDLKKILFNGKIPVELMEYICQVEDDDNKCSDTTDNFLTTFVRLSNPEWDENQSKHSLDVAFLSTVEYIKDYFLKPYLYATNLPVSNVLMFKNSIKILLNKHNQAEKRAKYEVMKAFKNSDGKIVVLPLRLPWYNFLIPTSALLVINPSNRGGYHLQCIPTCVGSNAFKIYFPISWLQNPPFGCFFVHSELFLAAFMEEQQAVDAAQQIIESNGL